jgi:hypothetical protein
VRLSSLAPARRALLWRVAAAAALSIGYISLAQGGITLAPWMLVAAYVVLLPAVILTW